ncbi:rhodanese-like domain-containing protein [Microbacterium sp. NPDC087592]|uniref:rhodanese-like domain-containing protein n=1 Tax=Microbacterium sp. NPDC087592 TaxID=3364193 RepID=UPI00381EAC7C
MLVLDVRSADEVAIGLLPDSVHVPHTELRGRLDEVADAAAGRSVRVMCASGVRSVIANRVLSQAGFDSAFLSGGMLTLRAVPCRAVPCRAVPCSATALRASW